MAHSPASEPPRGTRWVLAQALLGGLWLTVPRLEERWPAGLRGLGIVLGIPLAIGGMIVGTLGFVRLGRSFTMFPRPKREAGLVTEGIYAYVRNPMYDGVLLVAIGLGLATGNLGRVGIAGFAAWFLSGKTLLEEEHLAHVFPNYEAYRAKVPWRFAPGIW